MLKKMLKIIGVSILRVNQYIEHSRLKNICENIIKSSEL